MLGTYFKGDGRRDPRRGGFFDTGDVATIDPDGYMQITDRAKDVIKSGGEWISTDRDRESRRRPPEGGGGGGDRRRPPEMGRAAAADRRAGGRARAEEERRCSVSQTQDRQWWMPDDMQVVEEIPHTATGKINKLKLRETFKDYKLPTA